MEIEVYCDESQQDLFTTDAPGERRYLLIGSLWIHADIRQSIKSSIKVIREKHSVSSEFKWSKVSIGKIAFYEDLVDLFFSFGNECRFRAIAVPVAEVDIARHDNDQELGFYKFYYQLLHHWVAIDTEYSVFCDIKTNKDKKRLHVLQQVLSNANPKSIIRTVQALPSRQVDLIQLSDFFLGAVGSRFNLGIKVGGAKDQLVSKIESSLGVNQLAPTAAGQDKFNIFRIHLGGGN